MNNLLQPYLDQFNQILHLPSVGGESSVWELELTESELRERQQEYANAVLQNRKAEADDFLSAALIFYGYRLGAVRLKDQNECVTRQGGYQDNAIWTYSLDDILDVDAISRDQHMCVANQIEWIIHPGPAADASEPVLTSMILPMVKTLCRMTPPGKTTKCIVAVPPVSEEIVIKDWSQLFQSLNRMHLQVQIVNYGELLNLQEHERKYIVQHQSDGEREFYIVSAYERIRDTCTCLGCIGFDVIAGVHYTLHDPQPLQLDIDTRSKKAEEKDEAEDPSDSWHLVPAKLPISNSLVTFLSNQQSSFGRTIYTLSGVADNSHPDAERIRAVFGKNESLEVLEVCARVLQQDNLYNIALNDLAYVAGVLHRNASFKTVSIDTRRKYKLGTFQGFAEGINISKLRFLPANYASITWNVRDRRKSVIPYHTLSLKLHSQEQIIESIVAYYDHCTTSLIAEDLLYFFKHAANEDPSAFFAVKVYLFLLHMNSVVMDSKYEHVSIELPEVVEYEELLSNTARKPREEREILDAEVPPEDIPINEVGFSSRIVAGLKKANIQTLADLLNLSLPELRSLRAIGKTRVSDILRILAEKGYALRGMELPDSDPS